MNFYKNRNVYAFLSILLFVASFFVIESCSSKKLVAEKPGALLWGENCIRCHNAPSPSAFSDVQWETIAMHMKVRANLPEDDIIKIVEFLKMAN